LTYTSIFDKLNHQIVMHLSSLISPGVPHSAGGLVKIILT